MKKIVFAICFLATCTNSFSQTCEEREEKLLQVIGSFSAGFLYNTYAVIGCIADGQSADVYDVPTATDLLEGQKRMAENMIKMLDELKAGNSLEEKSDQEYIAGVTEIIKGLKKQAELLLSYVKTKAKPKLEDYTTQRKENWKQISKLMGIEE